MEHKMCWIYPIPVLSLYTSLQFYFILKKYQTHVFPSFGLTPSIFVIILIK